jgi:anti-sigma regulatory factor (Ser/Thr protein kinase)
VVVELSVGRAEIELRVTDHGPGFSWPGRIELPKPEDENGRGLYLIRRVMDSVKYERRSGRNVLVLRMKRREERASESRPHRS